MFQREVEKYVEEGLLKKTGGADEVERLRKIKDERARKENWERAAQRKAEMEAREAEQAAAAAAAAQAAASSASHEGSQDGESAFEDAAEHNHSSYKAEDEGKEEPEALRPAVPEKDHLLEEEKRDVSDKDKAGTGTLFSDD